MNVQDLAAYIGISRRTLFECRSADSAATGKTLAKLEAAERRAGICEKKPGDVVRESEVKDFSGPDEKNFVDSGSEYIAARGAALAAGLARSERHGEEAKGALNEVMRDLYLVLSALAASGPLVSTALVRTAQERIERFAADLEELRKNGAVDKTTS